MDVHIPYAPNIDPWSARLLAFLGIICGSVLLPRGQTRQTNAWCQCMIQLSAFPVESSLGSPFSVINLGCMSWNKVDKITNSNSKKSCDGKFAHFESKIDSWWEIHQCNRGGSLPTTSLDSTGTRSMPVHQVAVAWQRKRPIVIWQCVPKKGVFHPLGTFLSFWSDFVVWLKIYVMSIQQWLVPNYWGTLILFAAKLVFGHGIGRDISHLDPLGKSDPFVPWRWHQKIQLNRWCWDTALFGEFNPPWKIEVMGDHQSR